MALTKVAGDILDPGISIAGVVTATAFDGPFRGGSSSDVTAGVGTFTELDVNGNVDISGNLTVNGDYTTLNTTLREVEILRVDTNSTTTAGIITQTGTGDILNLFDGTTEVFTVKDGGGLTLSSTIDVTGQSTFRDRLQIIDTAPEILLSKPSGGLDSRILNDGSGNLIIGNGTNSDTPTERARIASDGKVGINESNPRHHLTVNSGTTNVAIAVSSTDTGSYIAYQDNTTGDSGTNSEVFAGANGGSFVIHTDASTIPRVAVTNGGKIGVNTTSALNAGAMTLYSANVGEGTATGQLELKDNAAYGSTPTGGIIFSGHHTAGSQAIFAGIRGFKATTGDGNYSGSLGFDVRKHGAVAYEAMRIDEDGRVGIGTIPVAGEGTELAIRSSDGQTNVGLIPNTNSESSQLTFYNASNDSAQGYIRYDNSDNSLQVRVNLAERLRITSAGSVGINSTSPDRRFTLHQDATCRMNLKSLANSTAGIEFGNEADHNAGYIVYDNTDNSFIVGLNGTGEKIRIKSDGNLKLPDGGKIELGGVQTGAADLSIWHDSGGNSYIKETGGGALVINADDFYLQNVATTTFLRTHSSGQIDLTHSGNTKLSTSSTGITVTGEVAASQDYPNYRPIVDWNFAAVKKLDPRITYQRTGPASYTDELGIVKFVADNTPRFDHDPVTRESKGLLIEPSRTNLFASSDAANSVWIVDGSTTKEANTTDTKDPAGTYTACKLMSAASANSGSQIYDGMSRSSGGVQSLWAKKGTHNVLGIYDYSGGSGIRGWFDLNTGEHRCEGGSKVAAGVQSNGNDTNNTNMIEYPNGWYRCIYYEAANMTYAHFRICDFDSDGEASASSNSIYLWGLQAEDGGVTFATSHIPCNTGFMPGTVTRGEDVVLIDGTEFTDFFNPTEGTSVVHAHMPNSSGNSGLPSYAFKNSAVSQHTLQFSRDGNASPVYHYYHDGSNTAFTRASATGDNMYKGAMSFKTGDLDSYVNGTANANTTSFTMPAFDNLRIGGVGGANQLGGHVARFIYYPKKLSNSQLIGLTS